MIGNDVVDLNLAKTQSNWQRNRFLEKQFTDFEINQILISENPFLHVWLFWSMKEAAYKCHVQEFQKRFFAPKKFSCKIVSNSIGVVEIDNIKYNINYTISNRCVYSFAFKIDGKKMVSELFFIKKNEIQTKNTNEKLLTHFSSEVQIQKNELGIPYLVQNNQKLPFSISTSHHGNYGAYAILDHR
ncbi:MAG: 4'-phosphopantetheinyl transferase superfamily protein [Polaribacter sp.]|uniref:4'-phosphopantetheinyl transferase family protein n=1 Tax=Polaribacter sp. TaxID=1920175 RepID=UPI003BB10EA7